MRQVVLSPRWLVRHAVAAALVVAFLLLGWWQWREAAAGGTPRNVAYALEWPLFAGFVVFLWWRALRAELRGRSDAAPAVSPPAGAPGRSAAAEASQASAERVDTVPVRRWSRPAAAAAGEPDPALADYNRHLAELDARHRNRQQTPGAHPKTTEEKPT
ncbi:MAG TPA: hypothetical protein VGR21_11905 [Cryptosporangiaceae bacterium]|nr:hypothetical protein [Cryptosporangiaceae bacterium]